MNSDSFAAPNGQGVLGLAKELRSRCEEMIRRGGPAHTEVMRLQFSWHASCPLLIPLRHERALHNELHQFADEKQGICVHLLTMPALCCTLARNHANHDGIHAPQESHFGRNEVMGPTDQWVP